MSKEFETIRTPKQEEALAEHLASLKRIRIKEEIANIIRAETVGGYLEHWSEFKEHLTEEQQRDYFLCIANGIIAKESFQGIVIKVADQNDLVYILKNKYEIVAVESLIKVEEGVNKPKS